MPHFYSIGWLYRNDYRNAGYKLLTSLDITGVKVGRHVFFNQVILLFVGISPALVGMVTWEYIPVALIVGSAFLFFGWKFNDAVKDESSGLIARRLFFASLFYLPLIFSAMIIFKADT
jgi:protoheme IX farnesyltransferase